MNAIPRISANTVHMEPRDWFTTDSINSNAVIMRSNIVRYCIYDSTNWGRIPIRWLTHKRHPISRPNGRAMGCLLWIFERKCTALWRHCTVVHTSCCQDMVYSEQTYWPFSSMPWSTSRGRHPYPATNPLMAVGPTTRNLSNLGHWTKYTTLIFRSLWISAQDCGSRYKTVGIPF